MSDTPGIEIIPPSHHSHITDPENHAIPVRITETQKETPPLASFTSWTLLGGEAPFQILPQTERRSRTVISVASNSGNATPQMVRFGRRGQAANNVGFLAVTATGVTFIYEAGSEVWCMPQAINGAVVISIIDEWYQEGK